MWMYFMLVGVVFLAAFVWKLIYFYRNDFSSSEKQKTNIFSLKHKNAVISGEFFPTGEETLKRKLIKAKTNVMLQISAETDILICGKFPDWSLIREAKLRSIKVAFIDKASDLSINPEPVEQNNLESESTSIAQIPLGI